MYPTETITGLVKKRFSCRKYAKQCLAEKDISRIENFLATETDGPFSPKPRFRLVHASPGDADALKGLGTYGFIRNAPAFIIGAIEKHADDLEAYGYHLERIVLHITALGLGSCWLGGSFQKSRFAEKIEMTPAETVPAVLALGYRADNAGVVGSLVRWSAKAASRKPYRDLFYRGDFRTPLSPETQNPYRLPLEMLRLSPSASNRQPWRVVKEEDKPVFHFFLKRDKGYYERNKRLFNMADLQRVDMGIAMSHFELTAESQGRNGTWRRMDLSPGFSLPERTEYLVSWIEAKPDSRMLD